MLDKVIAALSEYTEVPTSEMTRDTNLVVDLDMSSLDLVDVVMDFEEVYEVSIPDEDLKKLRTIGDIVDYMEAIV